MEAAESDGALPSHAPDTEGRHGFAEWVAARGYVYCLSLAHRAITERSFV